MNDAATGAAARLITSSATQRTPLTVDPLFSDGSPTLTSDYADALSRRSLESSSATAVYLHLPFCPSRCLSCDHNTVVSHDPAAIDTYLDGLERELTLICGWLERRARVAQLHVGGGTPNYLSERQLVRLATLIDSHFDRTHDATWSLEANPSRATPGQLELLAGLGFNAIQFELRDLDPAVQRAIGRSHSREMLRDVFANARETGFSTIGMDLLYGLPGQTQDGIRDTVQEILRLDPDRVACHAYTRRPEVFAHQRAIDAADLPSLGDKLALFNAIASGFEDAGRVWVGLDAFVRAGDELAVAQTEGRLHKNWIGYSARQTRGLLGVGIGAISEIDGLYVQNHLDIARWQGALTEGLLPVRGGVRLDAAQQRQREAVVRLMCNLTLTDQSQLGGDIAWLAELERNGLMQVTPEGASITPQGRVVLHHLWSDPSPRQRWDALPRMTGTA